MLRDCADRRIWTVKAAVKIATTLGYTEEDMKQMTVRSLLAETSLMHAMTGKAGYGAIAVERLDRGTREKRTEPNNGDEAKRRLLLYYENIVDDDEEPQARRDNAAKMLATLHGFIQPRESVESTEEKATRVHELVAAAALMQESGGSGKDGSILDGAVPESGEPGKDGSL